MRLALAGLLLMAGCISITPPPTTVKKPLGTVRQVMPTVAGWPLKGHSLLVTDSVYAVVRGKPLYAVGLPATLETISAGGVASQYVVLDDMNRRYLVTHLEPAIH